ncbi:hydrolase [Rhodoblastus acidophilus]|uniref:Hydrolase n=1 Tax=Candidatus Rhodoblastus alkanivorans TaxID=2954117 RepID=A0ABS9ZC69_9HYPH|nr:hydrolase [Candidatus Rhodoblastus alkanivorans]MCI4678874.1 hydrolase [Candidatus Rhodoblastus alkanivorans]MCI4684202.1 hydrolase [Candidatus Rhodoblastus alkanivorans]MDI4641523.1 hydrolase [Rhodoblastus acidophilus]
MITLDPKSAALVLIDLQNGIVQTPTAPHSAPEVVIRARSLATRFRQNGAPLFPVRVAFAPDFADAPRQKVDAPMQLPAGGLPPGWSDLVEGVAAPGDIVVTKRQWGAFHGTELELQLRRRSVKTLVLGGIATNFGVQSTARQAWELGFEVVIVEDACASRAAELHDFAIRQILPRVSRVTTSVDVVFATA